MYPENQFSRDLRDLDPSHTIRGMEHTRRQTEEGMEATGLLGDELVRLQARGLTLSQIAGRTGIPAARCAGIIRDHLNEQYSSQSVTEQRMLQIRRLEMIMNALWDQVMSGDLALEGKGAANLIKLIENITDLLDLKKDRLRDEQVRLTQAQTHMIIQALDAVKMRMLSVLLSSLPPELHRTIETVWHEQFSMIAENAIAENEVSVITMGGEEPLPPPDPQPPAPPTDHYTRPAMTPAQAYEITSVPDYHASRAQKNGDEALKDVQPNGSVRLTNPEVRGEFRSNIWKD